MSTRARKATSYRAARRNRAKRNGWVWRVLPRERMQGPGMPVIVPLPAPRSGEAL